MKLLLADDDQDMLEVTTYALRRAGYQLTTATDGLHALRRWELEAPDLVLLDVSLPRLNGIEVCRRIRASSTTPVIMLTARSDEEHVVRGFQAGADDYVTKPFSHRQLALRIRAVLQRAKGAPLTEHEGEELRVGPLVLDLQSHEVRKYEGPAIQLTPIEFRLLHILAQHPGKVVRSSRMIEFGWGYDGGDASVLKTHISHIRTKLGIERGQPGYIASRPHVGYVLTLGADQSANAPREIEKSAELAS